MTLVLLRRARKTDTTSEPIRTVADGTWIVPPSHPHVVPDGGEWCVPTIEMRSENQHCRCEFRAACLRCGHRGEIRRIEAHAVLDALDHAFFGWRGLVAEGDLPPRWRELGGPLLSGAGDLPLIGVVPQPGGGPWTYIVPQWMLAVPDETN